MDGRRADFTKSAGGIHTSSYRQDTNVSFVKIEIGEYSPTEVRIDIDRSSYVLGTRAGSAMKFDEHHVPRKHANQKCRPGGPMPQRDHRAQRQSNRLCSEFDSRVQDYSDRTTCQFDPEPRHHTMGKTYFVHLALWACRRTGDGSTSCLAGAIPGLTQSQPQTASRPGMPVALSTDC